MKRLIGIPLSIAAASAVAMANFTLTFTSSATDTWQLVGADQGMDITTLVGSSTSPGSAAAVIESAWYYDSATSQWTVSANTFNPAQVGYTLLTATNPYDGVWMRVKGGSAGTAAVSTTTDGVQASFAVNAGWNLRGVGEIVDTASASQLVKYPFLNDKTNGVLVYTYNVSTNAFEVYSPNGFVSTFTGTQFTTFNAFEGFWIKVDATKTYAISDAAASVTASLPVTDGIIGDPGSLITPVDLADNVINNFSTLLKFGPQTRLASASITSFSGTASSAMGELNSTMRDSSAQVITTRDSLGSAKAEVAKLVGQLSATGFVSTTTISGPTAKVQALIDDVNASMYAVSGIGEFSDFNLSDTNGSAIDTIDNVGTSIGLGNYLTLHPTTGDANITLLDPILLNATKSRDKAASLSAHIRGLEANMLDLNTTMRDLNLSISAAANGSDVNSTFGISAPDVNSSAEQLKVITFRINDVNGSNQITAAYVPEATDPSTGTVSFTVDFNQTVSGTGVTWPIFAEDNLSILSAIKNSIEASSYASTVTVGSSGAGMNVFTGELNITGVASLGKNFGLAFGIARNDNPAAEANGTTATVYNAAVTGSSQQSVLTFEGSFKGGDKIDLNISYVEDHADVHYTGSPLDSNVTLILTADKTGAEVAALMAAEINTDTTIHGFGDPSNTADTTGSIAVSGNQVTLDANDSYIGTGYTLVLTVNGNTGLSALATQASLTAASVYTTAEDYETLTRASGSSSIVNWEANASNLHQAIEAIRFQTLSVDGAVYTDSATRLVWDVEEKTSLTACGASNRYNVNTWALPSMTQLLSLYDASTNAMSLTWLNALTFSGAAFTITPSTGTNLDKLFFVSKDGNVTKESVSVSTERRVLSASGLVVRDYNATDTSVHMSAHCVAQQTGSTGFDEYYNSNRFDTTDNDKTAITSDISGLVDADKIISDSALTIGWERKISVTASTAPFSEFANAEYYCAILNHGGQTDWRLPTIEELTSLNLFDIEARYNVSQSSTGLNRSTLFLYDFNDSSNYWSSDVGAVADTYKVLNPVSDVSTTNLFSTTSPATGATNTRAICVRNQ